MKGRALMKIDLNYKRNLSQDNTATLDQLALDFDYQRDRNHYWNPEEFSLLWGTPLWHEASAAQRMILNHLFWVAYYAQIISAEIVTIFMNQTSAAALFSIKEFHTTCRMLDLESFQERAHIHAFREIGEKTEQALFGHSLFLKPLKTPYLEPMIYQNTSYWKQAVKGWLLRAFALLSSHHVFIGCQYFTVRGLRTLNGKMVQHKLGLGMRDYAEPNDAPIPTQISHHHFLDESYHFNSSILISKELVRLVPRPTNFEKFVVNQGVLGCQRDHFHFNSVVSGIFWYEPALFKDIYYLLRSPIFAMPHEEAMQMMERCFTKENEGMHRAYELHQEACVSYSSYAADLEFLSMKNRDMSVMKRSTLERHLAINKKAFNRFRNLSLWRSPQLGHVQQPGQNLLWGRS